MTELLAKAFQAAEALGPAEQDMIADVVLRLLKSSSDDLENDDIDPDHLLEIELAIAEVARGEIATDEEVEAALRSFER